MVFKIGLKLLKDWQQGLNKIATMNYGVAKSWETD